MSAGSRTAGPPVRANGQGLCEAHNLVKEMPGWSTRVTDPRPGQPHGRDHHAHRPHLPVPGAAGAAAAALTRPQVRRCAIDGQAHLAFSHARRRRTPQPDRHPRARGQGPRRRRPREGRRARLRDPPDLRRQPARLGALGRQARRGRRASATPSARAACARSSTRRTSSTSAPPPPRPTRARSRWSPTTCAGPSRSAPRASSCTPARSSTRPATRTRATGVRRRDAPGPRGPAARRSTRLGDDDAPRGCCWSPPPARAARCAPASRTSSPTCAALDFHPKAGICLDTCHVFAAGAPLDEPGGADGHRRPDRRDRRTGPAAAGPRQRLDGRARRVQGPAPADRRGPHRRRRVRGAVRAPGDRRGPVHPGDARLARRRATPTSRCSSSCAEAAQA